MTEFNDKQRWAYPPKVPTFPQDPAARFMPFLGRPLGDESYRHTTVLSIMGRGPVGPKGEAFTYDDMTPEQKEDLARSIVSSSGSIEDAVMTLSDGTYTEVQIPLQNFSVDNSLLSVYLNGLKLTQGVDFYTNDNSIVFNTSIVISGTSSLSSPNELMFSAINLAAGSAVVS